MTINALAAEFARLDPQGCGEGAGYRSHDGDFEQWPSVGYYTAGGNYGHCVVSVHPDDVGAAVTILRRFEDGAANVTGPASLAYNPEKALRNAGVRCTWHV